MSYKYYFRDQDDVLRAVASAGLLPDEPSQARDQIRRGVGMVPTGPVLRVIDGGSK